MKKTIKHDTKKEKERFFTLDLTKLSDSRDGIFYFFIGFVLTKNYTYLT